MGHDGSELPSIERGVPLGLIFKTPMNPEILLWILADLLLKVVHDLLGIAGGILTGKGAEWWVNSELIVVFGFNSRCGKGDYGGTTDLCQL